MASKMESTKTQKLDGMKWFCVIALILTGIVANYHYNSQPWALRLLAWLFLIAVALAIVLQTAQGRRALDFTRESQIELKKVVWPNRPEVIQTTLIIGALVIVLALLLWGVDGILVRLIGWLTGQRG